MYDRFNRKINYLRISITDKCNLRCRYCMPEEGIKLLPHTAILSFDEIVEVTREAVKLGVDKVRITGGEPLVRRGVIDLISMIGNIDGIRDFGMTTNAILLDKFATDLKKAGLNRVNISLDTLDPEKYTYITRGGNIQKVFDGINAAKDAGLAPIKINCVIKKSHDEPDAKAVADFCKNNGLQIRYIHEMDLEKGEFSIVEGGDGGNCSVCNRLRLTAEGDITPCLFSDLKYNVREMGARNALLKAVENKPACGSLNHVNKFHNIGG